MLREVFREAYGLSGPMLSVEELPWGRTNRTYKISIPSDTYILQRLPEGPTDDCKQERAIERFADVRGELARRGSAIMLPEFVTDVRGATVTDFRGDRYVLQRYMPNTWHPLLTPERARSAGRLMGRLRRDLSGWEPPASRWEEDALDMRDSLVRKHEYLLMTLARSARDP